MIKPKAFIFDMNGTMINDMSYHIKAWRDIVNGLGANLTMEEMKAECYGKSGEMMDRIFPGRFTQEEKDVIEMDKEQAYQDVYRTEMKLIDGLQELMDKAQTANIAIGIGSAAITFNVNYILDGLNIRPYFKGIVSASNVTISKPHPETFLKCAALLGVNPAECVVFEDAPKGVEAALNAGMPCVVITTMHTKEEFSQYSNIVCFIEDYTDPQLEKLFS